MLKKILLVLVITGLTIPLLAGEVGQDQTGLQD